MGYIRLFWVEYHYNSRGIFVLSQPQHIRKLELVPSNVSFERFRSLRAIVAWVGNTRSDICCAANRAAQVTEQSLDKPDIDELNTAIKKVKESPDLGLKFNRLDESSIFIKVYVDASFATNKHFSSQLGYVVLVCDANNACHFLDYASRKSRRVVRSIMGGEVLAFSSGFDRAFIMRKNLEDIYKKRIPMTLLTYSKHMFDVIRKGSSTEERPLLIDVAMAREAYNSGVIEHCGLVKSEHNVVDGLTKVKVCKALNDVITTGYDRNPVAQWIKRSSFLYASPSSSEKVGV